MKLFNWTDMRRILSNVAGDVPKNNQQFFDWLVSIALFNGGISIVTSKMLLSLDTEQLSYLGDFLSIAANYLRNTLETIHELEEGGEPPTQAA